MKESRDPWYVRLPDGRTFKAKSTSAVRHHIEAGTIPLNSFVRRDPEEEWTQLAWVQEFANQNLAGTNRSPASLADFSMPESGSRSSPDGPAPSGVSSRLDPLKLQTVGIRGYVDELYAAFDSSLQSSKLMFACAVGAALLVGRFLLMYLFLKIEMPTLFAEILTLAWSLAVLAVGFTLIGKQTHLELTRMAPVSFSEAMKGYIPTLIQLLFCFGILGGIGYGSVYVLGFLRAQTADSAILSSVVIAAAIPILTTVFLVGMVMFLLAPIVIVEDCSFMSAFREWRALLREHRLRVVFYEGIALAMGIIACLPLYLPVFLAMMQIGSMGGTSPEAARPMPLITESVQNLFLGVAFGPFIAFLAVTNVFIYLNLRYEYTPNK
jgi:hypothetical protein